MHFFFVISLNRLTQKSLFLCAIIVTGSIMQLLAFAIEENTVVSRLQHKMM